MICLAIVILVIISVFIIISAKEKVPAECEASAATAPFYRIAVWIEKKLYNGSMRKKVFGPGEEKLRILYPASDTMRASRLEFIKKCALVIVLLGFGMLLTLAVTYSENEDALLSDDSVLKRREYGEGKYSVEVDADIEGEKMPMDVTVDERVFTRKETEQMLPSFKEALESAVLGRNKSPDHVEEDLDPVSEIKGYPFYVEWEFANREVINRLGEIKSGIPEEGSLCELTARISYEDMELLHTFSVMVYPKEQSGMDKLHSRIEAALSDASYESRSSEDFALPEEVDGIKVVWQERKKNSAAVLVVMIFAAVCAVFWGKDKDLDRKIKERDEQIAKDYPEMVSKLSLYIGAGMSTRMAWRKIAEEYRQKGIKRYVYEEMLFACREMDSGVSEIMAYQHFAKRCRLQRYVKLVSLLEQNSRLGAAGFLSSMRNECRDALQERKADAARCGEEAATKLLLPMVMMLAIVMVVIIVPAFVSI